MSKFNPQIGAIVRCPIYGFVGIVEDIQYDTLFKSPEYTLRILYEYGIEPGCEEIPKGTHIRGFLHLEPYGELGEVLYS